MSEKTLQGFQQYLAELPEGSIDQEHGLWHHQWGKNEDGQHLGPRGDCGLCIGCHAVIYFEQPKRRIYFEEGIVPVADACTSIGYVICGESDLWDILHEHGAPVRPFGTDQWDTPHAAVIQRIIDNAPGKES